MSNNLVKGSSVHDRRRLNFDNPGQLDAVLRRVPLDEDFIDWVCEQDFMVIYERRWKAGHGDSDLVGHRIYLGSKGSSRFTDHALTHELLHAAVPDRRLSIVGPFYCRHLTEYYAYERLLDRIAIGYLTNTTLVHYAKARIPSRVVG